MGKLRDAEKDVELNWMASIRQTALMDKATLRLRLETQRGLADPQSIQKNIENFAGYRKAFTDAVAGYEPLIASDKERSFYTPVKNSADAYSKQLDILEPLMRQGDIASAVNLVSTGSSAFGKAFEMLPYFLNVLGVGALTTVGLTLAAFTVAALLGFFLALMRLSRHRTLGLIASCYLEIFRNIPILTQLFILYFGLTYIGITLPAVGAAIIGFGLNGAAILSEVFRSSIKTIDKGQAEAAYSIGMTRSMAMRIIVLWGSNSARSSPRSLAWG